MPEPGVKTRVSEILDALSGLPGGALAHTLSLAGQPENGTVYVEPETENEVCEIVRLAHGHGWKVCPAGGLTHLNCGNLPNWMDLVVSTKRMNQVVSYVPGDLVVTVQPGVVLADLQALLGQHKQMLPLDPVNKPRASMGGIAARAVSGPRRALYGTVRDMTIGLRAVCPNGNVVRAGGKVVKNVAGYDLTKLFVGSYGTLGVFTELTFKLRPLPMYRETCVLTGTHRQVEDIRRKLVHSFLIPARAELLAGPYPEGLRAKDWAFAIDCDENESSCLHQTEQLRIWANELDMGFCVYRDTEANALWDSYNAHLQDAECVIRFAAPPTELVHIAEEVRRLIADLDEQPQHFSISSTVGSGRIFLNTIPISAQRQIAELCRLYAAKSAGSSVIELASGELRHQVDTFGSAGPVQALFNGVKHTFDPNNILNPGWFVGGI